jgi:catechol 2,3-dioxygenase-like lactoylglutathione lyase family enzyme
MARLINHLDLTVSDMSRSRAFYQPVMRYLGYEVSHEEPREIVFSQADGGSVTSIGLYSARGEGRARLHDRNAPGLHHLAFDAESREDVDGLHALLRDLRAEILDPPAVYYQPDYYAMFFADPDRLKIELAHTPSLSSSITKSRLEKAAAARGAILRKIDCVMTKVGDLTAARDFYQRVLGLKPLWSDTQFLALGLPESDAEVVLHDDPQIPRECNVHYLVDDVKEAVASLDAEHCEVIVPPFEVRVGMCAIARDPFGNLLNLIDMSKGRVEDNLKRVR